MARLRDVVKEFAEARWRNATEVEIWVEGARSLDPQDLAKLAPYLKAAGSTSDRRRARASAFKQALEGVKDPQLFPPLFKAALKGDEGTRRALSPALSQVQDVRFHREICNQLKHSDPMIRRWIVALLREFGGKTALGALGEILGERGWDSRIEAMELAVELGGHHAIPMLELIFEVGKPNEQIKAIKLLGDPRYMRARKRQAMLVLAEVLKGGNRSLVLQALQVLPNICTEDDYFELVEPWLDGGEPRIQLLVIQQLASYEASERVLDELDRLYRIGRPAVREAVLKTLQQIGSEDVLPTLIDALSDRVLAVRNIAQEVLAAIGRSGKVEMSQMLLWLMRSRDVQVKRQAIELVRDVGDPHGTLWPEMMKLLRDEDWWVRERVVEVLVEIAGLDLTRHVAAYLDDPSDVVRRYAVEVLMRIKDPRSLGALVKCAGEDSDWWVQERAIECLGEIGDARVVPHIINLAKGSGDLLYSAVQALGKLADRRALPFLTGVLTLGDAEVKLEAVAALKRIGDPSVTAQVQVLVTDVDLRVRDAAVDLLAIWESRTHADSVTSALANELSGLERLLWKLNEENGDDLFLISGQPPAMKRLNMMVPLSDRVYTPQQVDSTLRAILTPVQWAQLEDLYDVDCSVEVKSLGLRFRANIFRQMTGLSAVFRKIEDDVAEFDALGLPSLIRGLCDHRNGLVLVGGPTGSGKSTTLAAMINHINQSFGRHIITIEDPIERVHHHQKSLVNQREVGSHTHSFATALRATLREDPDVILVGEMRDLETIHFAVTAAETGHLVFGTVHTVSADTTMDRLINAFPIGQQQQVRAMLSTTLRAVICQQLVRRVDGKGRVPAIEIMLNNEAISNLIRKGQTFQIPSVITTSRESGMQSMDSELLRLYRAGVISAEETYVRAINKGEVEAFMTAKAEQEKARKKGVAGAAPQRPTPAQLASQQAAGDPRLGSPGRYSGGQGGGGRGSA